MNIVTKSGLEHFWDKIKERFDEKVDKYIDQKSYENDYFYNSTTNGNCTGYDREFATVVADEYNTPWVVKLLIEAELNYNGTIYTQRSEALVGVCGATGTTWVHNFNVTENTSYSAFTYINVYRPATSTKAETNPFRLMFRSGSQSSKTAYPRKYKVTLIEQINCNVSLNETLDNKAYQKWAYDDTTKAYYDGTTFRTTNFDCSTNGLQETGDANNHEILSHYYAYFVAGTNGINRYTIIMQDKDGNYQSIVNEDNNVSNALNKTANTAQFRINTPMFYYNSSSKLSSGSRCGAGTLRSVSGLIDMRYSLNIYNNATAKLTAYAKIYLVGTIDSEGYFKLDTTKWWAEGEPTTDDGKVYIYLGVAYPDTYPYRIAPELEFANNAYWYKNGQLRHYPDYGYTVQANVPVDAKFTDTVVDISGKVNKTGDTLSGSLVFGTEATIARNVNNEQTMVLGASTANNGATLQLKGKDNTSNGGSFQLTARDGTNTGALLGRANGSLTWNAYDIALKKDVVVKTGDTMTGNLNIRETTVNSTDSPTGDVYREIRFKEKDDITNGVVRAIHKANGNKVLQLSSVGSVWTSIELGVMPDGTRYANYNGTVSVNSNDGQIATTKWVRDTISPINTSVTDLDRRITAAQNMINDIYYWYETDDTEAYSKQIPTGAKMFDLKKLGSGKTVVANQMLDYTNAVISNGNGTTVVNNNDGTFTITGTPTEDRWSQIVFSNLGCIEGHKYFIYIHDSLEYNGVQFYLRDMSDNQYVFNGYGIIQYVKGSTSNDFRLIVKRAFNGTAFKVKPMCIDLTKKFGIGNEPTLEQCREIFSKYVPYTEPTLVNHSVDSVVVNGKNLFKTEIINPAKDGCLYTLNSDKSIRVYGSVANTYISVGIPQDFKVGTYTFSCNAKVVSGTGAITLRNWSPTNMAIKRATTFTTSGYQTLTFTITEEDLKEPLAISLFASYSTSQLGDVTFSEMQLEQNATATSYSAPIKKIITIPASAKPEGYGWSAGTSTNYIESERKKFVKVIDRVDLGTLKWNHEGNYFYNAIPKAKVGGQSINPKYETVSAWSKSDNCAFINISNSNYIVMDSSYTDATVFKQAMSGVYLYYELAEPIEIDIDIDNRFENIKCEGNGSITFVGNTDYNIPVLNEEEYVVKLSEVQ